MALAHGSCLLQRDPERADGEQEKAPLPSAPPLLLLQFLSPEEGEASARVLSRLPSFTLEPRAFSSTSLPAGNGPHIHPLPPSSGCVPLPGASVAEAVEAAKGDPQEGGATLLPQGQGRHCPFLDAGFWIEVPLLYTPAVCADTLTPQPPAGTVRRGPSVSALKA